jgi:predicted nucleic acid-binding protein
MASSWICVDANLVVRLVADPQDTIVRARWQQWEEDGQQLAAPTLIHYETTNALYQYERRGYLNSETVRLAQEAALALPLTFHGDAELHRTALRLAQRLALPATYDAHYLAVAERLGAELWTADRRLLQAVRDELSWVRLLAA